MLSMELYSGSPLTHLTVRWGWRDGGIAARSFILGIPSKFPDLISLEIYGTIPSKAFIAISSNSFLRRFEFRCEGAEEADDADEDDGDDHNFAALLATNSAPSSTSPLPFPALTELDISFHAVDQLLAIVSFADWKALNTCTLTSHRRNPPGSIDQWIDCFKAWSRRCDQGLVTRINIEVDDESVCDIADDTDGPMILTFSCFVPLLPFHALRALRLDMVEGFDLGDDEIQTMAAAWPRLEELALSADDHGWPHPTRITLAGLKSLLHHCSRLSIVAIVINLTMVTIDYLALLLRHRTPNYHIKSITLGNTVLDPLFLEPDLEVVDISFAFLSLMPNLQDIRAWGQCRDAGGEGIEFLRVTTADLLPFYQAVWREVNSYLPTANDSGADSELARVMRLAARQTSSRR